MASEINLTPTASLLEINDDTGNVPSGPITARTWGTASESVAGALLVHGLGAHSGWFEALGRRLKVRRIFALAYDQVGFGRRIDSVFSARSQWFAELTTAFTYLKNTVGEKPIYILANSMGAAVALKVVADRLVAPSGLVMFSPGFEGHPQTFKLGFRLRALWSAFTSPDVDITLPYNPELVTRDPFVRSWITKDPQRRFAVPGRMLLELLKLSLELEQVKQLHCPILMLQGGVDNIVDARVSEKIFARIQAPSKQNHCFTEAWHDLMFDPVLDELVDRVAVWISQTSSVSPERLSVG